MKETEIRSVEQLIEALRGDLEGSTGDTWYRGQAEKIWPLLPSLLRLDASTSERTLLKKFKQSAALLIEKNPKEVVAH